MAHHLSDKTIENFLSTLKKEGFENIEASKGRKVQTYDFKKALRFSQDQIRTLTRIHENFARLFTSYLSTMLRTYVQLSVASVEQYSYEEFIRHVEEKSILGVIKTPPLQGSIVMEFTPGTTSTMLDRMLGGQGNTSSSNIDLTEIEISLIERVFVNALISFEEAWSSVVKFSPELKEIEVNPQFLTVSPPSETIILVSLQANIGNVEGLINICLPHLVLEEVLPKLSARHWLANQKKAREDHEIEALEKKLQTTKLEIKALLGKSTIEIGDFLNLKSGDVIRLNESYDDPVVVLVDEKQKFLAQPGISKGRTAVQVTNVYEKESEFDDN